MSEDADSNQVQDLTRSSPPPPLPTPTTVTTRSLRPRATRSQASAQGSRASTSSSSRSRAQSTRATPQLPRFEAPGDVVAPVESESVVSGSSEHLTASTHTAGTTGGKKRGRRPQKSNVGPSSKKRKVAQTEQPAPSATDPDPASSSTTTASGPFGTREHATDRVSPSDAAGSNSQASANAGSDSLFGVQDDPKEMFERMMADAASSSETERIAHIHSSGMSRAHDDAAHDAGVVGGGDAPAQRSRFASLAPSPEPATGPSSARDEKAQADTPPRSPKGQAESAQCVPATRNIEPLASYSCPICLSPPTYATITPCGHVLCGDCLFSSVKTTMERGAYTLPMSERYIPRCVSTHIRCRMSCR